jgi:hypothetical protein
MKKADTFHWNHRVLARTYRKGTPSEETIFEIHECYYDGEEPSADEKPGSCTVDAMDVMAETLDELRHTLARMLLATYKPVLDYDSVGRKERP